MYSSRIPRCVSTRTTSEGRLMCASGTILHAELPDAALGDICTIHGKIPVRAEVIGFTGSTVSLAPLDHPEGLDVGAAIVNSARKLTLDLNTLTPGAVLDPFGAPLRRVEPPLNHPLLRPIEVVARPPHPLERAPFTHPIETGIRAIDTLLPLGYGQRVAVIAEAGVGKSTLLGTIAQRADVDIIIIGLVGERGREVPEFLDSALGPTGQKRAIVVVSTSDDPAGKRALAPLTATRIAEVFRAQGRRVLLLIDSLTRYARALRDLGLARGEIPLRQGLTPSIYTELPRLFERAGTTHTGSISAIYTVLTHKTGEDDALTDEIKSLLDGHIVLSNELRNLGFYPAIDPTRSISRSTFQLLSAEQRQHAQSIIRAIYRLLRDRDLCAFGGTPDRELAAALRHEAEIKMFMNQADGHASSWAQSWAEATRLSHLLEA